MLLVTFTGRLLGGLLVDVAVTFTGRLLGGLLVDVAGYLHWEITRWAVSGCCWLPSLGDY